MNETACETRVPHRPGIWTLTGLALALLGPLALATPPMQRVYAIFRPDTHAVFAGQASLWVVLALALACLVLGERLPLAAVGLVRPHPRSIWTGLAIGAAVYAALFALVAALLKLGLFDADRASEIIGNWPLWLRLFALITAGVVEEALYRGFAIERLTALTGSKGLAAMFSLAAFSAAHVPFWGLAALAAPIVGGGFFTLVYLWRRDLVACMVAHIAVDFVGLVLAPALGVH